MERDFDLIALGDPVLDVVVRSDGLPAWDDKNLGDSVQQLAGGSEANAACVASRLGLRTSLFGQVGGGVEAEFLCAELRRHGVSDEHLHRASDSGSATAVIYISRTGERAITYVAAKKTVDRAEALARQLGRTRSIYTMPYDMAAFSRTALAARAAGALVAVDVESAVAAQAGAERALLQCSDLMLLNEGGFMALTGQSPSIDAATALLQRSMARTVVVTLGAQGALAVDREEGSARQAAYVAQVIDTTGAGDTFNAAFLAARLQGRSLQDALSQGCAAACLCVEAAGARGGIATPSQVAQVQRDRPLVAPRGLA